MLQGKRVLIVGGGSGIGWAVARQAVRAGARVAIASRRAAERAGDLAPLPAGEVTAHAFDIDRPEDHPRLLAAVGTLDHLVVAVRPPLRPAPLLDLAPEEALGAFATKFWGAFRLLREARSHFAAGGSVVLTSGIAGERIYPGVGLMAVINRATEILARVLAVELAPVRVNVVSPGFVAPKPPATVAAADCFPLRRLATADEVALAYLALMDNPYVTGAVSVVDGGARLA